jgi:hypothetical protein
VPERFFDELAKATANGTSRRAMLRMLAGVFVGALAGTAGAREAAANPPPKKKCKVQGSHCKTNADCCSLTCCNRTCCGEGQSCSGGQCVACGGTGQPCCTSGTPCTNGGCCSAGTCVSGTANEACGRNGQTCVNCAASFRLCQDLIGTCEEISEG